MFALKVDDESSLVLLEERYADELFALTDRNRAYLKRWLPWLDAVRSVDDTRDFMRATLRQFADGNGFQAGLSLRGQIVGVAGLHFVDRANRLTSLGYWLGEEFQGRGLMTRACAAILDHVFGALGLNLAEIRCAVGNEANCAIPERLGFTREGILRQREWLYDHFVDHVVYAILSEAWGQRQAPRT